MNEKPVEKQKKVTVQINSKLSIYEKLGDMQCQLKIPRKQYNDYAKFYYRSCEDILEAVKPVVKSYRMVLILQDEVVMIGTRFYVKAIVTLKNLDDICDVNAITVTAYAREEEVKKGMDGSQITGSSSSYARKYALSGLFGIDDSKDSDTTNKEPVAKTKPVISKEKLLTNDDLKALGGLITKITNAKSVEELTKIGKEIKETKLNVNQQAVLRESWGAKFQRVKKLPVAKTK